MSLYKEHEANKKVKKHHITLCGITYFVFAWYCFFHRCRRNIISFAIFAFFLPPAAQILDSMYILHVNGLKWAKVLFYIFLNVEVPLIMFKGKKSLLVSSRAHVRKRALLQCIRFFFYIKFYLHTCILHAAYLLHWALFDVVISFHSVQPLIELRCVAWCMLRAISFFLEIIFLLFCHLFFFFPFAHHTLFVKNRTRNRLCTEWRLFNLISMFWCFASVAFFPFHTIAMQFSLCYDIW